LWVERHCWCQRPLDGSRGCHAWSMSAARGITPSVAPSAFAGVRFDTALDLGSLISSVNADWSCAAYLRVSLCADELRLRTGAHRSVRTRSVTFADDSLTMIIATPGSAQPFSSVLDLRCGRFRTVLVVPRLSSALSSGSSRSWTWPYSPAIPVSRPGPSTRRRA
jgi:hypothetical protein